MVRMQFSRGSFIDEKGNEIKRTSESPAGNIIMMSMVKNKSCPPNRRTGFYTINYLDGVDYISDLVDLAIRYDAIIRAGAWYDILDVETGESIKRVQGIANVYEFLKDEEHEAVLTSIEQYVNNKIEE